MRLTLDLSVVRDHELKPLGRVFCDPHGHEPLIRHARGLAVAICRALALEAASRAVMPDIGASARAIDVPLDADGAPAGLSDQECARACEWGGLMYETFKNDADVAHLASLFRSLRDQLIEEVARRLDASERGAALVDGEPAPSERARRRVKAFISRRQRELRQYERRLDSARGTALS